MKINLTHTHSNKGFNALIVFASFLFISTTSFSQTSNTLPASGNVGVGTINPATKLDVVGNTIMRGTVKIDSMVTINDSLRVQKKLIVDQDLKIQGASVFVGDGKFKNKLTINGLTKMKGDAKVFGDFKIKSLADTALMEERFLFVKPNGKVTDLDRSSLLKIIYGPPILCIISENGGQPVNASWSMVPNNPGHGILYTGVGGCPTRVGIGTNNPIASLDVRGRIAMSSGAAAGFIPVSDANGVMHWKDPLSIGINSVWSTNTTTSGNDIFYSLGNVSIGTTKTTDANTTYMLSVAGDVRAESVEVSLENTWPDYVFEKDYSLSSLKELEEFITDNKHLPNVPSAKEVKDKGINLGEMDAILLKKIEELTLYVIQQQKKIEELEKQVELNK